MKNIVSLLLLVFLLSCHYSTVPDQAGEDCVFIPISDANDGVMDKTEQDIMKYCRENRLTSIDEITQNVIGEWELTGHAEGGVTAVTQPCGYITVAEDSLTFEFEGEYYKTRSIHDWEIKDRSDNNYPSLIVDPSNGLLRFFVFCEKYMFQDNTAVDGRMFLYEKVK